MSIAQELMSEFEVQAPVTRRFLEGLPEDKLMWKPHHKSMTAGQLAFHLAMVPGGVCMGAQPDHIPPPDFRFPQPETKQEVLAAYDESVSKVRELLPVMDDARMNATWRVMAGDHELLAMPRRTFLRDVMLNHWYQHRGQFSVYLRMLEVPVPSSFGPSADEPAPGFQK